jgi:CubicO group peptidase (beta-lactamase class C family)
VTEAVFEELRSVVAAHIARVGVPGLALGLLHNDTEYTTGFGVTSIDNQLPVDGDTLFQIGSITKTFVATAAMRLVDEGRLDLDRPVSSYMPDLRLADAHATNTATARHLLTHSGGWIGDYFADTGRGDDALARYVAELANLEQLTPPGAVYSYCNSGFSLLGRLIEVLTGETFENALQRLVLKPLGLEHSYLFPEDVMTRRYAVGHTGIRIGDPLVLHPWQLPRSATPAGGLIASVKDQLRYARFQLGDGTGATGERVLTSASVAAMRQPLLPSTGLPDRFVGLAWNVIGKNFSHGGSTYGQRALLSIWPEHGLALSLLTNAPTGEEVMLATVAWVVEHVIGMSVPRRPLLAVDGAVLDGCVGLYKSPTRDVEVGRLGDTVVLREIDKGGFPTRDSPPAAGPPPPVIRMGFYADDRLVGLDPPFEETRAELLHGADGRVAWRRRTSSLEGFGRVPSALPSQFNRGST